MRRSQATARKRDVSSDDDDGSDDVISDDDDDFSSDVSGSSVPRRLPNKDNDSDVPRFFYGRASDNVATGTDRRQQTDDVGTPRASRDTSLVGTFSTGPSRATAGPGKPLSRGPITTSFHRHRDRSVKRDETRGCPPDHPTRGLGRRKLPHRGPGQSPDRNRK